MRIRRICLRTIKCGLVPRLRRSSSRTAPRNEEEAEEDDDCDDDQQERPFRSIGGALLALFRMAMGNFDMSWFEHTSDAISSVALALFVSFMVFFFLVCVNVLIAVVADSYDYALFRARKIYLCTKLQLVAEFEAVGLTTLPLAGNGFFMDKCVLPLIIAIFANPLMLPISMLWAETLKNNPMDNDKNQDAWDGRVRHIETRLNELFTCTARVERRVGEQIRELRTEMRTETRQQIAELRAELRTEMRGHTDEICAALRALAAQRT